MGLGALRILAMYEARSANTPSINNLRENFVTNGPFVEKVYCITNIEQNVRKGYFGGLIHSKYP